jgi:hypothetical protein
MRAQEVRNAKSLANQQAKVALLDAEISALTGLLEDDRLTPTLRDATEKSIEAKREARETASHKVAVLSLSTDERKSACAEVKASSEDNHSTDNGWGAPIVVDTQLTVAYVHETGARVTYKAVEDRTSIILRGIDPEAVARFIESL